MFSSSEHCAFVLLTLNNTALRNKNKTPRPILLNFVLESIGCQFSMFFTLRYNTAMEKTCSSTNSFPNKHFCPFSSFAWYSGNWCHFLGGPGFAPDFLQHALFFLLQKHNNWLILPLHSSSLMFCFSTVLSNINLGLNLLKHCTAFSTLFFPLAVMLVYAQYPQYCLIVLVSLIYSFPLRIGLNYSQSF